MTNQKSQKQQQRKPQKNKRLKVPQNLNNIINDDVTI